jgi:predicted metal-dependent hydrolase
LTTTIYHLIRSRRKSIALIVQRDGKLVVRAPLRTPQWQIEAVVKEKEAWIRAKQEHNRRLWKEQAPRTFNGGEEYLYMGKKYRLVIVEQQKQALEFRNGFYLRRSWTSQGRAIFEKWYREQAREVFTERVEFYARSHDLLYKSIHISGARTRWGSCGAKGTLNFSWRLAMALLE